MPYVTKAFNVLAKCYSCNKPGHISRDCPTSNSDTGITSSCYECGRIGHNSYNCPKKENGEDGTERNPSNKGN